MDSSDVIFIVGSGLFVAVISSIVLLVPVGLKKILRHIAVNKSYTMFETFDQTGFRSYRTFILVYGLSILVYLLAVRLSPLFVRLNFEADPYEQSAIISQMFPAALPFIILFLTALIFRLRSTLISAFIAATAFDALASSGKIFRASGALGDGLTAMIVVPFYFYILMFIGMGFGVLIWYLMELHYKEQPADRKNNTWQIWIVPAVAVLISLLAAPYNIEKTVASHDNLLEMRKKNQSRTEYPQNQNTQSFDSSSMAVRGSIITNDSSTKR